MTNISADPASPTAGNAVQFGATIKNQGATATPNGAIVTISFLVDGTVVNWSNNLSPYLIPGAISIQSANSGPAGTSTWAATVGTHTVTAFVDDGNSIAESNETNNKLNVALTVASSATPPPPPPPPASGNLPDLIVANIGVFPANPSPGDLTFFNATIQNQGTASTPGGVVISVAISVDGTLVSWENNDSTSLVPGGVRVETPNSGPGGSTLWTATAGSHTVIAFVDDGNTISESNETNNRLNLSLNIGGGGTPPPAPSAPAAPTGLTATAGDTQVSLSWSASSGATSYNVKRSTTSGGSYTTVASPTGTSYVNTGLANGTTYYYVVSAVNSTGESANSSQVSATPQAPTPPPPSNVNLPDLIVSNISWEPAAPSAGTAVQFTATLKNQGSVATPNGTIVSIAFLVDGTLVNWSDNLAPVIYPGAISIQSANGGSNGTSKWTAAGGTHTVTAFVDDANRITESNETNNKLDATLTVSGGTLPSAPAAPTGLTATAGDTQVSLSWSASSGATSYNVKRSTTSGGSYTTVASPTGTSYINTGLANGMTYYYVVSAVNSTGESANSSQASATPQAATPPPPPNTGNQPDLIVTSIGVFPANPAPGNLTSFNATIKNQGTGATPVSTTIRMAISVDGVLTVWADNDAAVLSAGESRVETPNSGSGGSTLWTATAGSHTISAFVDDTNLIAESNETNNKLDLSLNIGGGGTPPPPPSAPAAPTGLTATAGDAQVSLSWSASSGATSYNVKRSTTSGGSYTTLASPTGTSYVNTGLANGTTYYYVVSAVNSTGESANSSQASATPQAPTPPPPPPSTNSPDLIVTNVGIFPANPSAGDLTSFNATIKNQGTAATPASVLVSVAFSVDGTLVAWENNDVTSLIPSEVRVETPNSGPGGSTLWTATAGSHTIMAFVDDGNTITESNETNNKLSVTLSVGGSTPPPPPPPPSPSAPAAPTGLTATAGNGQVTISWTASSGATSYNVKRLIGTYTTIASPTTTSYTETGLANGTTYTYVVSAVNSAGESANSAAVAATPTAPTTPPPSGTPNWPAFGTTDYNTSVQNALAANTDTWGQMLMARSEGPTYENTKGALEPLDRVNSEFKWYPLVLSLKEGLQKARLAGHGNQIDVGLMTWGNWDPANNAWVKAATSLMFFAGAGQEEYGLDNSRRVGPLPLNGYLPIYATQYTGTDGKVYQQQVAAEGATLVTKVAVTVPAGGTIAIQVRNQGVMHVVGNNLLDVSNNIVCSASNASVALDPTSALFGWIRLSAPAVATTVYVSIPYVPVAALTAPSSSDFNTTVLNVTNYWNGILAQGASIQVPETVVMNAWRSLLISNFSIVRDQGMLYSFGNYYEQFYTYEATRPIIAFALYGFLGDAWNYYRQANRVPSGEFHLSAQVRTGYELYKLGVPASNFTTISGYFANSDYTEMKNHTDTLNNNWKADPYGLQPKGVYAGDVTGSSVYALDHNLGAYAAIRDFALLSSSLGFAANGSSYSTDASNYRPKIMTAINSSINLTTTPPFVPQILYGSETPYFKITSSYVGSYYNIVMSRGQDAGVFPLGPKDVKMDYVNGYLEQHGGRLLGLLRFNQNNSNLYTGDGFDDVYQSEYDKNLLWRDEVDKFLVGFYGKLAHGMTPDTFVGAEVIQVAPVAGERGRRMYLPPNSAANAHFLHDFRNMLLLEEDDNVDGIADRLYILKGTPRAWLDAGKRVAFSNMPTYFGRTGVDLTVSANGLSVSGTVAMPASAAGKQVILRLRRPAGFTLKSVLVNGVNSTSFDAAKEEINLTGYAGSVSITANY